MRKIITWAVVAFLIAMGLSFFSFASTALADTTVCETESTGWVTEAPQSDEWKLVDQRTIVDEEAWTEEIVISEAVPGQHYSYTGGPVEGNPTTVPPGDDWQANTHQEPHKNNPNVTWVDEVGVGLHYTSHGSSGNADYFYYQPPVDAVIEVIEHEAVTHEEFKFEREVCKTTPDPEPCQEDDPCWDCETMGNKDCGPDTPPADKPEHKPDKPAKPELPHTGAGSTALLGLLSVALITSGGWLYRKFS